MTDDLRSRQPRSDTDAEVHEAGRQSKRREQDAVDKEWLDDMLDEALEESFPASDPVSITQPTHSAHDRRQR
jgi:hypothetical protein